MGAPHSFLVDLDLTLDGQDRLGLPRLYPGDDVRWRFQVEDEGGLPVSLTGFAITLTVRRRLTDASPVFRRTSEDPIVGAIPESNQITIDADQGVEDADEFSGRGWFEVRFASLASEESLLLEAVGLSFYDIVLRAPNGAVTTFAEGPLEIARRTTRMIDVA